MGLDIRSASKKKHIIIREDKAEKPVVKEPDVSVERVEQPPLPPVPPEPSAPSVSDMSSFLDFEEEAGPAHSADAQEPEALAAEPETPAAEPEPPAEEPGGIPEHQEEPDIIKLKPEDVDIYREPLTEELIETLGNEQAIRYKTAEVAERLGVSAQLIRNYSEQYDSILHVEKTQTGHRRFSEEDIQKLELILQLKTEKGLTAEQTIEFFQSQDKPLNKLTTEMKFDVLLQLISERVNAAVNEALETHIEKENEQRLLIEQYDRSMEENAELISSLTEKINIQSREIEELKNQGEDYRRTLDELNDGIKELMAARTQKKGFLGLFK